MGKQRFALDDKYDIIIKINSGVNPPRPIYDAEISMTLINRKSGYELHITNHHWHSDDLLGKKLSGHPSMKIGTGRKIFLNLSEGPDPKQMSFDSLKTNFIDKCCQKIGESYRHKLKEIMNKVRLGE